MINSRTLYAEKNAIITALLMMAYYGICFACRTVFTLLLGQEFLGIQGVFSDILSILSFAELGLGNALIYLFYKPIHDDDKEQINSRLEFCKKIYHIITGVIIILGVGIIPFLKGIIGENIFAEELYLIYVLYLTNSIVSYFWAYKKTLLIADQKSYVVNLITQLSNIFMNIIQIIILYCTRNYFLYLITAISFNFLSNLICSLYVNKKYEYLRRTYKRNFNKIEQKTFVKSLKGLFLVRIAGVSFSSTDNIFVSKFVGITAVGVLSQYTLISIMIHSFVNTVIASITSSIGNLAVESNKKKEYNVFSKVMFANNVIYGMSCITLSLLLTRFVSTIWLNDDYWVPQLVPILICIDLFFKGNNYVYYEFRNAYGNFHELAMVKVFSGILNIVLDYVFVIKFGVIGVLSATIISQMVYRFSDIYVLFKLHFCLFYKDFVVKQIKWIMFIVFEYCILSFLLNMIDFSDNIVGFIIQAFLIILCFGAGIVLLWRKTEEYNYFKCRIFAIKNIMGRENK